MVGLLWRALSRRHRPALRAPLLLHTFGLLWRDLSRRHRPVPLFASLGLLFHLLLGLGSMLLRFGLFALLLLRLLSLFDLGKLRRGLPSPLLLQEFGQLFFVSLLEGSLFFSSGCL